MPEYPWIIYRMSEGPLTTKEVHQGVNEQLNRKLGTDWGYSEYEWANLLQGFRPLPIRTASGTIAHFEDGAEDVPMKSVVANITPIQSGSGTPSPSNPRPISGTSVLNVEKRGKNFLNLADGTKTVGSITMTIASGKCTFSGNVASMSDFSVLSDLTLVDGVTYTLSGTPSGAGVGKYRMWVRRSDSVYYNDDGAGVSFTYDKSYTYEITIRLWSGYGENLEFKPQIELGNTATTYEPYNAETYTIDLGQEIMGGTADVVGGSGEETHEIVDLGDLNYTYISAYSYFYATVDEKKEGVLNVISDIYETTSQGFDGNQDNYTIKGGATNHRVFICNRDYTDPTAFKTAMTGRKICYEVTTPTDFTFTGQPINSYLGVNNVWTDSGEVLDVEYRSNF